MIRVLIVDNTRDSAEWLADALFLESDEQIRAQIALDADAARDIVKREGTAGTTFDAFLIDQFLGSGEQGIEVMQSLMQLSPDTESIIFTGATDDPSIGLQAYDTGAYAYIYKNTHFKIKELVWQIQFLHAPRKLNEAARQAQGAKSFRAVADAITSGAQQLGFERVHLWSMNDDTTTMTEVSRAGDVEIPWPAGPIPVSQSPYAQRAIESPQGLHLFNGDELGPGYYQSTFFEYKQPVGMWPLLSLRIGETFIGLIILDNAEQNRKLHMGQCRLLRAFARQAAAALARAREQEAQEKLRTIGERVTQHAARRDLAGLIQTVRKQIGTFADIRGFTFVLMDMQGKATWLDYHTRYQDGAREDRKWRRLSKRGLIDYVLRRNKPLFLPDHVSDFRHRHDLRAFGKPAKSFIAVPLKAQHRCIGVIALEDNQHANAFTREQFRRFQAVAERVQDAIYMTRLEEEEEQQGDALEVLQQASAAIASQVELQNEEDVWHVALTVATAHYGLRFNRAVTFLSEGGGNLLRACAGIGELQQDRARRAWERDIETNRTFERYLADLNREKIEPTPLQTLVQGWTIDLGKMPNAFTKVLQTGKYRIVPERTARHVLPLDYVDKLGIHECAVVPLKTSKSVIGLVVLDNAHNGQPISQVAIRHLEPLLTQTALMIENMRQRKTQSDLIVVTQKALADFSTRPLRERLDDICESLQSITDAECVFIYPLASPDAQETGVTFDETQTGAAGDTDGLRWVGEPFVGDVAANILRRDAWTVNLETDSRTWGDKKLRDMPLVKARHIRALHGCVVKDSSTGEQLGVAMLLHRQRILADDALPITVQAFIPLIAATIRTAHTATQMHSRRAVAEADVRVRDQELREHHAILEESLRPDTPIEKVVQCALEVCQRLLHDLPDARVELMLKEWQRRDDMGREPRRVRKEYWLEPHKTTEPLQCKTELQLHRGIAGKVFQHGEVEHVPDVSQRKDFYGRRGVQSELVVPIKLRRDSQVVGAIMVEATSISAFSPQHVGILERLVAVVTLALDNVRRQERTRQVIMATEAMTAPIDVTATFEAIKNVLLKIVPDLSALSIWSLNEQTNNLRLGSRHGAPEPRLGHEFRPNEAMPIRAVLAASEPVYISDAKRAPVPSGFATRQRIQSYAGFALRADGKNIGAMFLSFRHTRGFEAEEKSLLVSLAEIASASIRDALMLDYTQRQAKWLNVAQDVGEAVATTFGQEEVLRKILEKLKMLYPPETQMCIYFYNESQAQLEITPASREFYRFDDIEHTRALQLEGERASIASRVARKALDTKEVAVDNVPDTREDPDYVRGNKTMRSELCVSLLGRNASLLGVLIIESPTLSAFKADDEGQIRIITRQISIAVERANLGRQLRSNFRLATMTSWAARLAHDLKPTIGVIKDRIFWLNENLRDQMNEDDKVRVDDIASSAQQLATAVENSAYLSTGEPELIELDRFLHSAIYSTAPIKRGLIRLSCDLACPQVNVRANTTNLKEVIRHLVQNAARAAGPNGLLTVRTRHVGRQWVEISFCDTGPGVPPEIIPKLFREPVVSSSPDGSGQGLLLVTSLMEHMRGYVQLMPTESDGRTTFTLSLRTE